MRAAIVLVPLALCSPDKVNGGSRKVLDFRFFFPIRDNLLCVLITRENRRRKRRWAQNVT
jgi:hypothetical protein